MHLYLEASVFDNIWPYLSREDGIMKIWKVSSLSRGNGYRMKLFIIFQLRLKCFVIELILVLSIFGIYSVQQNRQRIIDGLGLIRLFFWFPERCFWASSVVRVVSVQ